MADPSWQEVLRLRLIERNNKEAAYAPIIEQYRRLAQQAKLLKERNSSLLKAVGTVRSNPNSSTVFVQGSGDDNPVRAAYVSSLESQISSLRDEMAAVYKTQGQNAQRLLAMNETLREKEEVSRAGTDELRRAKEEILVLRRKVDQHNELMGEKDERLQILHDEIQALELELNQMNEKNKELKQDNASLLSRWLDKVSEEAEKVNVANIYYEDMKNKGWDPNANGTEDAPQINRGHRRKPSEDTESYSTQEESAPEPREPPTPEPEWLIVDEYT